MVSANRQMWINALREDVAEFMEKEIEWRLLFVAHQDGQSVICKDQAKADEIMERIRFLTYRIELRLHPGERDHDTLINLIAEPPTPPRIETLTAEIKAVTQGILRREWKRAARAR